MKLLAVIALSLSCSICMAQTTNPSVESDLRRIISGLQTQIADLKNQVAAMQKENAELRKQVAQPSTNPSIADAIKEKKLIVGMTKDDALKVINARKLKFHTSIDSRMVNGKARTIETWDIDTINVDFDRIYIEDGIVSGIKGGTAGIRAVQSRP